MSAAAALLLHGHGRRDGRRTFVVLHELHAAVVHRRHDVAGNDRELVPNLRETLHGNVIRAAVEDEVPIVAHVHDYLELILAAPLARRLFGEGFAGVWVGFDRRRMKHGNVSWVLQRHPPRSRSRLIQQEAIVIDRHTHDNLG